MSSAPVGMLEGESALRPAPTNKTSRSGGNLCLVIDFDARDAALREWP
jgi:hypothetical protein